MRKNGRDYGSIFVSCCGLLLASIVPSIAAATDIGSTTVAADEVTTPLVRPADGTDLDIQTLLTFGSNGPWIRITAANGAAPLIGPVFPMEGGHVRIRGGDGSDETAGEDGGNGGDVVLRGGEGGEDNGSGNTGNGGNVILIPGPFGTEFGLGGITGACGQVLIQDCVENPQLEVGLDGVKLSNLLQLDVRTDSPVCSSASQGAVFVSDDAGGAAADGLCVCLDTTGGGIYAWVDLTGNGNCP